MLLLRNVWVSRATTILMLALFRISIGEQLLADAHDGDATGSNTWATTDGCQAAGSSPIGSLIVHGNHHDHSLPGQSPLPSDVPVHAIHMCHDGHTHVVSPSDLSGPPVALGDQADQTLECIAVVGGPELAPAVRPPIA